MIKYILNDKVYRMIQFNTDTEDISTLNYAGTNINDMFIIPEDGFLNGEEVHKGDIVFWMYSIDRSSESETIIITDSKLKDYYRRLMEYRDEKEKECENSIECDCATSSKCKA